MIPEASKIAKGATLQFSPRGAAALPPAMTEKVEFLRQNYGVTNITPIFSTERANLNAIPHGAPERQQLAMASSLAHSESDDLAGFALLDLDAKAATPDRIKALQKDKAFSIVEAMPSRWLCAVNDPLRPQQWGLDKIGWDAAGPLRAASTLESAIRVGVLDSGVDIKHPDLAIVATDYRHAPFSAEDILGHGTHICGIIAATVNNGFGIAGISHCKLAVWKIFGDTPDPQYGQYYIDSEAYLRALAEVAGSGVRALNLSIGGTAKSQTEQFLFSRLSDRGIVVCAAMGNEYLRGNPKEYPGAYQGVVAVGAVNSMDHRASFSNTGRHVKIAAPGVEILSTLPMKASKARTEREFAAWSGTSMATAHVSAAAGILLAKGLSGSDVIKRLTSTATKRVGKKAEVGQGLLNLAAALG